MKDTFDVGFIIPPPQTGLAIPTMVDPVLRLRQICLLTRNLEWTSSVLSTAFDAPTVFATTAHVKASWSREGSFDGDCHQSKALSQPDFLDYLRYPPSEAET